MLRVSKRMAHQQARYALVVVNSSQSLRFRDSAQIRTVMQSPSGASVPTLIWFKRPAWIPEISTCAFKLSNPKISFVIVGLPPLLVLRVSKGTWLTPSCRWSKYYVIVGLPTIVVNLSLIDRVFQGELSWLQVVHMQYFEFEVRRYR